MAAYGVPDATDGVLPWSWAEERLSNSRNYWVVTVDPAGRPHASPVWGLWDAAAERFWFSCAPSSLKARNLAGNPHVVVAPDGAVEVVSLEGAASPADASARAGDIAVAYAEKYEPDPSKRVALAEFVLANALFCVTPVKALAVIEREDEFAERATRWAW